MQQARLLTYDITRLLSIRPTPATASLVSGLRGVIRATGPGFVVAVPETVTVPTDGALSPYAQAVIDDGASNYYRLDDGDGSTLADLAGGNDMTKGPGVTANDSGAIGEDSDGSAALAMITGLPRSRSRVMER